MSVTEVPAPTAPPTPMPQANPPIVIGPFANVPAPGSPIRSDWPQQISQYAWDTRLRTGIDAAWDIPLVAASTPGTYDLVPGLPNDALTYPARVTISMVFFHGFTSSAGVGKLDLYRYKDGSIGAAGDVQNPAGYWVTTPLVWCYDVTAGQQWGCKARITITTPGGSYSGRGNGFYRIQRTG